MMNKAKKICEILQSHGHEAVFAGGAVRDSIMGIEPHDYDIATSANPDLVVDLMEKNHFQVKEVGKSFGVVLVKSYHDEFEIATFRKDGDYTDGRHPSSVSFSNMEEDAKRRDLTINSIFYDPISNKYIDYMNGKNDIEGKLIRFVGNPNERIEEDHLRMLRAVRFAIKLDFRLDKGAFCAIRNNVDKISKIAPERINQELEKMFMCKRPSLMIDLLVETGLMHEILPEIERLKDVPQEPKWHPEGAFVEKI